MGDARAPASGCCALREPPVIVVSPGQELPPMPDWIQVLRVPSGLGPLAGSRPALHGADPRAAVALSARSTLPSPTPA